MANSSISHLPILKVDTGIVVQSDDLLAIEEPLEIRIEHGSVSDRQLKSISVTMRTPGNDFELALGFLFTEGIIKKADDIENIEYFFMPCAENKENILLVKLKYGVLLNLQNAERNFYTTSSCGVCGKASIDSIRTINPGVNTKDEFKIPSNFLNTLPDLLRAEQNVFDITGGLHASAIFNLDGDLLLAREDVGRHNALDKLIGAAMKFNLLPLSTYILLLSGRASFELIQKAAMAGIKMIAAIGAPSSLAVELAQEFDMTLVGFLRNKRFNIYSGEQRILIN